MTPSTTWTVNTILASTKVVQARIRQAASVGMAVAEAMCRSSFETKLFREDSAGLVSEASCGLSPPTLRVAKRGIR